VEIIPRFEDAGLVLAGLDVAEVKLERVLAKSDF
jgi:hypothetical protein